MKRRQKQLVAVIAVLGLVAATLIGVRQCSRRWRTGTVTIDRRASAGGISLVEPFAAPAEIAYLDDDVRELRVQLIIRNDEKQDAFTARMYDGTGTAPLRVEHIARPVYVRVVGDAFERNKLRRPGEPAPSATAIAVAFTLPTDVLRRKQPYVVRLSGARDQPVAKYTFTTN